jgi:membrane-associated phospholipid phosphatase
MAPRRVGLIAIVCVLLAPLAAADEPNTPAEPNAPAEPSTSAEPNAPAAPKSVPARLGGELVSDFKWSVNNVVQDGIDVVKSPCHVGELLTDPAFYWTTLGAGAALGVAYGLDVPARNQFMHISHKDATHLESWGNVALWGATGVMYGYGFIADDARARHYALTGLLSTAISGLVTSGLKVTFGRERPLQNHGHNAWFQGGSSFVSGATTPAFALAADVSEFADNRWYVALPAYMAAASVGLGRMGKDAHWLSDVTGSALLGVGTTELLLHMHALHDADPERFRVFPLVAGHTLGLGVTVAW